MLIWKSARPKIIEYLARAGGLCIFVVAISLALVISPTFADSPTTHTVAWGETLYSIARMYGVTPQSIASANRITVDSWVYAGTRLTIPSGTMTTVSETTPSGFYTVRAGDTLFSIASRFRTTVDTISSANNLPANGILYVGWSLKIPMINQAANQPSSPLTNKPTSITHIVQVGESVTAIALRYGTTAQAIAMANNLPTNWMIYSGQRLNIPTVSTRVPAIAPTNSSPLNVRVSNVPLFQQKQTLTCEEASAAMATRGAISENQLVGVMTHSDNPFNGIRGSTNSAYFGGLNDYGVYAQGLQKGLTALGVRSQVLYGQTFDDFKSAVIDNLRAARPIIWWHTWQDSYQVPVMVKMSDGKFVKLVPYEHAGVIVAANDNGITYHDPYDATIRFISWAEFRRVSAYFDNMALVVITNDK